MAFYVLELQSQLFDRMPSTNRLHRFIPCLEGGLARFDPDDYEQGGGSTKTSFVFQVFEASEA